MKVVIAAAGTGGHINPGIAIANQIKMHEPNSEIVFIGTKRGLENDLVPRAGYKLFQIEAYGISRKMTLENVRNFIKTFDSISPVKKMMKEFKPDIVIGTGGYICVPAIMAAKKLNIPTALHESNAFPGIAVKMFAKKVDAVFVGFKDVMSRIPNAKRIVLTGTPTKVGKMNMTDEQKNKIKQDLGLDNSLPMVLVFGGSQGAKSVNEALINIIKNNVDGYQIMWAAGPKQYDVIKEELSKANIDIDNIKNVKIVPYIYNMEEIMNTADVVVSRSGALTTTEIAKVGKPAIFIPFPFATENHQEYNAKVLEKVGAAKIILDKDLTAESLDKEIHSIIEDKNKQVEMGKIANTVAMNDVEETIYKEIKEIIK